MKNHFKKSLATLALLLAMASGAHASTVQVTVGNDIWDVSLIDGNLTSLLETLDDQIWWGDEELAFEFTATVADSLGTPNFSVFGPLFAYSDFDSFGDFFDACIYSSSTDATFCGITSDAPFSFAIAEFVGPAVVPVPPAALLFLSGLAALGITRRRTAPSVA